MSDAGGVAQIFGEAVAAARAAAGEGAIEADQPDLLDLSSSEDHLALPDAAEVMAIAAELGTSDMGMAVTEYRRRAGKGGRKAGSKNRRTNDFRAYLLQFGPHPGVSMMRLAARPVELLAAELGCSKIEAASLQQRANAELLPYFEGKVPVQVQVSGAHMTLIMAGGMAPMEGGQLDGGADALPLISFAENQGNQPLSDGNGSVSE